VANDAQDKRVRLTVAQLRTILEHDPEGFQLTVDKLIAECTDPATISFWKAVKAFAKRPAEDS